MSETTTPLGKDILGNDYFATVEVPAEFYDEALAFCNARLREQGKPQISILPSGFRGDESSCPCAAASGVLVGCFGWSQISWIERYTDMGWQHSDSPGQFVRFFDKNAELGVRTLPIRKGGKHDNE